MTAAVVPFTIEKVAGSGVRIKLATFKTGRPATATDFTGCTARLHARARTESDPLLLDLTTENGGIELGADGSVTIVLTEEQVAAINWSTAKYSLVVFFTADGIGRPYLKGTITVEPEF